MQFSKKSIFSIVILTMFASVALTLLVADSVKSNAKQTFGSKVVASEKQTNHLTQEELNKINTVLNIIETDYVHETKREELIDGALSGIMASLNDPHSTYMKQTAAEEFNTRIEGTFSGIGAEVTMTNGYLTVVSPIKNSPAERGGILAKDIILSVNGESLEGLSLNEAVAKLRGPKGTKAKLEVRRDGVNELITISLIRDDIDIETVYSEVTEDGIGVITITQFALNTAERFEQELTALEKKNISGLVIDVRNNPGGVLDGVTEIAQMMLDEGKVIVQVEAKGGDRKKTYAKGGKQKPYPIAVLVNGGSASASEILAGALHESAGASIIGEQSFGKGTVQVSYNSLLQDGGLIKMTVAKWLTPEGNWINEKGVTPTLEVKPAEVFTVMRFTIDKPILVGEYNVNVKSMQVMLNALGYKIDRTDGFFSEETQAVLKTFQKQQGLKVTAMLDKETGAKLEQLTVDFIRTPQNDVQLQKAIEVVAGKRK